MSRIRRCKTVANVQKSTKGDGSVLYSFPGKRYKTEPSPFVLFYAVSGVHAGQELCVILGGLQA